MKHYKSVEIFVNF